MSSVGSRKKSDRKAAPIVIAISWPNTAFGRKSEVTSTMKPMKRIKKATQRALPTVCNA